MAKLFQVTETKIDSTTHLVPKVKLFGADHVQEVVGFGSGSIIRLSDNNNVSKITERFVTEDKASVLALMDVKQGSIKALSLLVLNDGAGDVDSTVKLIPVDYILEVESDPLSPSNSIVTLTNSSSIKGKKYTVQETLENILTTSNTPSSAFKPTVNNSTWVEVSQESDFGVVGEVTPGAIVLAANTIYFVRGNVTINSNLICNVEGTEIVGTDRNSDHLIWNGVGVLLTVTDVNFGIRGLRFSSNNVNTSILDATNIDALAYNKGRLKVLTIFNCQFRDTYDVIDIKGYDLVDINNSLFFYIKATNFGLRFEDTSKIQLSSCELIRWFDEATIPTPSGYATVSMIELRNNNLASFGAVNINGCIVHPQQTQNGIDIGTASTTGFGTISGSAYINIGLTTGKVFLPEIPVLLVPDYSQSSTVNYDIFANQGLLNSVSGTVMTVTSNTTDTSLTAETPIPIDVGALAVQQAGVRYSVSDAGRSRYIGTKQKFVSIHASIAFQKQGGGTDTYTFYIYKNGLLLSGSNVDIVAGTSNSNGNASINYGALMELNDYLEIYVENPGGNDDILIKDLQLVIRE